MMLLQTISSIIVFACVFNLLVAVSSFEHTTTLNINILQNDPTEYVVPGKNFALDDPEGVYYAMCRNSSDPNIHLCDVVCETLLDDAKTVQIHSCTDVAVPVDEYHNYKVLSMIPLVAHHVGLSGSINEDQFVLNLLDCSEARMRFLLEIEDFARDYVFAGGSIVYRDHFETVMRSKIHCGTNEPTVCRLGYSYNGTKLTPIPIKLEGSNFAYPVQPLTDSKGLYSVFVGFINESYWRLNVSYSEPTGESRIIASVLNDRETRIDDFFTPETILHESQISVGHELLSVCWPIGESRNRYMRCLQTDTNKVLLDVTVKMAFGDADSILPFNLPNGAGILIAEWSKFDERSFRIRWLRKDGSGAGKWLKLQSGWEETDDCFTYSPRGIETRARNEICIDVMCSHEEKSDRIKPLFWIKRKRVCVLKTRIFETLRM